MLPSDDRARLIWADKTALILAALAAFAWAVFWFGAFLVIGDQGASHLWRHGGLTGTQLGILGAMAAWLVLRAVDFAAGASTWRLCVQAARRCERALAKPARALARRAHLQMPQTAR